MKQFEEYFCDTIEYPNIGVEILPMNINYVYVSNTFLNGFINYTTPIKAFVLGRYHDWNDALHDGHTISVMVPPGSYNWLKINCKTKEELYQHLIVPNSVRHSKLDRDFQDDVVILAKSKETESDEWCYFYYWYDRDCSDCCIGRFQTVDEESVVLEKFESYCNNLPCNSYGCKEIPLHYFQGWLGS